VPIYRIINTATFLAFIFVIAPDTGPALTHFFGDPNLAKPIALVVTLSLFLFSDPDVDHFGLIEGERRLCQLLAAPVLAIAVFHIATGDYHQAKHDLDFTALLVFVSGITTWIASLLPDPPPDTQSEREADH